MGFDSNAYIKQLWSLLPQGKAWTRAISSNLYMVLDGMSRSLSRVDAYISSIVAERDTRTTNLLITEHETDLGLPDECSAQGATGLTARRRAATAKLTARGALYPPYFIDYALTLGRTITIDEFTPFWCGVGVSGDPCGDQDVIFHWRVNIQSEEELFDVFMCGEGVSGDSLNAVLGADDLICFFNRLKPAWTQIIFRTVGPGFSRGFSRGFDSLTPYDISLTGGFSKGFSIGFNTAHGGGFDADAFTIGFNKPQ